MSPTLTPYSLEFLISIFCKSGIGSVREVNRTQRIFGKISEIMDFGELKMQNFDEEHPHVIENV